MLQSDFAVLPPASRALIDRAIWSACDKLRASNCAGALQYVPELTWLLFLRILDAREESEAEEARGRRRELHAFAGGPLPLARLGRTGRAEARAN